MIEDSIDIGALKARLARLIVQRDVLNVEITELESQIAELTSKPKHYVLDAESLELKLTPI